MDNEQEIREMLEDVLNNHDILNLNVTISYTNLTFAMFDKWQGMSVDLVKLDLAARENVHEKEDRTIGFWMPAVIDRYIELLKGGDGDEPSG